MEKRAPRRRTLGVGASFIFSLPPMCLALFWVCVGYVALCCVCATDQCERWRAGALARPGRACAAHLGVRARPQGERVVKKRGGGGSPLFSNMFSTFETVFPLAARRPPPKKTLFPHADKGSPHSLSLPRLTGAWCGLEARGLAGHADALGGSPGGGGRRRRGRRGPKRQQQRPFGGTRGPVREEEAPRPAATPTQATRNLPCQLDRGTSLDLGVCAGGVSPGRPGGRRAATPQPHARLSITKKKTPSRFWYPTSSARTRRHTQHHDQQARGHPGPGGGPGGDAG